MSNAERIAAIRAKLDAQNPKAKKTTRAGVRKREKAAPTARPETPAMPIPPVPEPVPQPVLGEEIEKVKQERDAAVARVDEVIARTEKIINEYQAPEPQGYSARMVVGVAIVASLASAALTWSVLFVHLL